MNIIEETGHFGIRDLLFGEPAHHDIKTLSYCIFFEVELRDLYNSMRGDTDLVDRVEEEKVQMEYLNLLSLNWKAAITHHSLGDFLRVSIIFFRKNCNPGLTPWFNCSLWKIESHRMTTSTRFHRSLTFHKIRMMTSRIVATPNMRKSSKGCSAQVSTGKENSFFLTSMTLISSPLTV